VPQVASEAHAASHAGARSGQRNRPANGHSDAPPTPFASLIDRTAAGDDAADQPRIADRPADAVQQPDPRRADRHNNDRHEAGRGNRRDHAADSSRNDKPVHRHDKADRSDDDVAQASAKDTKSDTKSAGDADAAEGDDDTTVTAGGDAKDTKDDGDADALLADGIPVVVDPSQADAAKTATAEVTAAPVVAAQAATDAAATATAEADLAIGGDKPATPALLTANLKAAAGQDAKDGSKTETKAETKTDAATPADDSTLRDALKQHTGETRDGKPADNAAAKPADGDPKAAEQKTHHAAGAEKAADKAIDALAPGGNSNASQTQGPQNQPQGPQVQHTAQPAQAANAAPVAQQLPAVPVEGVAVQLVAQAKAGKHSFEIRLDPPELGRIDVRLDVDRHGHVTSRLVVDRPETLDLLRRDAGGLERALQDAGLKTSDNGLQFSLRDQSMQQQAFRQSRDTAEVIVRDDAPLPVETIQRGYRTLAGSRGGVDIRV
jgi:chemotaxis protein MotD